VDNHQNDEIKDINKDLTTLNKLGKIGNNQIQQNSLKIAQNTKTTNTVLSHLIKIFSLTEELEEIDFVIARKRDIVSKLLNLGVVPTEHNDQHIGKLLTSLPIINQQDGKYIIVYSTAGSVQEYTNFQVDTIPFITVGQVYQLNIPSTLLTDGKIMDPSKELYKCTRIGNSSQFPQTAKSRKLDNCSKQLLEAMQEGRAQHNSCKNHIQLIRKTL